MPPTHNADRNSGSADWPALPLEEWKETYATLHRWAQIVGKVRLTRMAWINHSWHSTLYVTCRGLTTSPMPLGHRSFQIDFDFIDHQLLIRTTDGDIRTLDLRPRSVADFYRELMATLRDLGIAVEISAVPNEMEDATQFRCCGTVSRPCHWPDRRSPLESQSRTEIDTSHASRPSDME